MSVLLLEALRVTLVLAGTVWLLPASAQPTSNRTEVMLRVENSVFIVIPKGFLHKFVLILSKNYLGGDR